MSKRFGRNQRRAMREAMDSQSEQLAFMQRQRDGAIANQRQMREALNRVARVLGPHFFGLPAVRQVVGRIEREYRIPQAQVLNFLQPNDMAGLVEHSVTVLQSMEMRGTVDKLRGAVHMRLYSQAGDVAYGISDSALACATIDDLTPEIAHILAAELRRLVTERTL
jgi:hypothetical protein